MKRKVTNVLNDVKAQWKQKFIHRSYIFLLYVEIKKVGQITNPTSKLK